MKVFCLFEQSGTFKNEFKKLGIEAEDYDIQNEFGETDHVIDLYGEIEGGYEGKPSIFDKIEQDDLIMAFFPCIRFEVQILLWFRGENYGQKNWNDEQKILYDLKLMEELKHNYDLTNKLFLICYRKGLQMIYENPYCTQHFLNTHWCIKPNLIDKDRTERGDYYEKPTQYWFVNRKPKNNMIFEMVEDNKCGTIVDTHDITMRSMIHPDYANRFIREFIL